MTAFKIFPGSIPEIGCPGIDAGRLAFPLTDKSELVNDISGFFDIPLSYRAADRYRRSNRGKAELASLRALG